MRTFDVSMSNWHKLKKDMLILDMSRNIGMTK